MNVKILCFVFSPDRYTTHFLEVFSSSYLIILFDLPHEVDKASTTIFQRRLKRPRHTSKVTGFVNGYASPQGRTLTPNSVFFFSTVIPSADMFRHSCSSLEDIFGFNLPVYTTHGIEVNASFRLIYRTVMLIYCCEISMCGICPQTCTSKCIYQGRGNFRVTLKHETLRMSCSTG